MNALDLKKQRPKRKLLLYLQRQQFNRQLHWNYRMWRSLLWRFDKNLTVQIVGLPFDLTLFEARKIANIILAHAVADQMD